MRIISVKVKYTMSMKVVIFAGGVGSRLSEETLIKPKPMVEIGNMPIIWHIMKSYSHYGYKDFIVCLGYKGYMIKEWFHNYFLHNSDVTIYLSNHNVKFHNKHSEDWKITFIDTGEETETARRLFLVKDFIGNNDFMLTYGDGLSDIDINKLISFHKKHGKIATVTAVKPEGRFGSFRIEGDNVVTNFSEKTDNDGIWINGGFFVLKPSVFNYVTSKNVMWEKTPMENLVKDKQLVSFKHTGFWKPMDTLRDKNQLEKMWSEKKAPWKVWKDKR